MPDAKPIVVDGRSLVVTAKPSAKGKGGGGGSTSFSFLFCDTTDIDPVEAIQDKLAENSRKYPVDLARGSAKKYTNLPSRTDGDPQET